MGLTSSAAASDNTKRVSVAANGANEVSAEDPAEVTHFTTLAQARPQQRLPGAAPQREPAAAPGSTDQENAEGPTAADVKRLETAAKNGPAAEKIAANKLLEDTADELRQAAGEGGDASKQIRDRANAIRSRVSGSGVSAPVAAKALDIIRQAEDRVLAEPPELRRIQNLTVRYVRAQEALKKLGSRNRTNAAAWDQAKQASDTAERDLRAAGAALVRVADNLAADTEDRLRQAALRGDADGARQRIADEANIIRRGVDPKGPAAAQTLDIIKHAEERVLGETPELRGFKILTRRVERAKEAVIKLGAAPNPSPADLAKAEEELNKADRELQKRSIGELGAAIASAHLAAVKAKPNATPAEIRAAEDQVTAARAGTMPLDFTDAERTAGIDAMKHRYQGGGLDAYFSALAEGFTEYRNEAAPARAKIQAALAGITAPQGMDPVTAALIKSFNLPALGSLSVQEQALQTADPFGFALLQKAGFRFQMGAFNNTTVTAHGRPFELTPGEQKMADENDISGLAASLLRRTPPDAETRGLMAAAIEARRNYTRTEVERLHPAGTAGTVEGDKKALATLQLMMKGSFSEDEASFLWAQYGEPVFNRAYFDRKRDEFLTVKADDPYANYGMDHNFGYRADKWLSNFGKMPPAAARHLIDSITAKFNVMQLGMPVPGPRGGDQFYRSFSALVQQAPDRAADAAKWYTTSPGKGDFRYPIDNFFTAFNVTTRQGESPALSAAIAARAEQLAKEGKLSGDVSKRVKSEYDSAVEEGRQHAARDDAHKMYDLFMANTNGVLNPFFTGLHTGPDVKRPRQLQGAALRDMIGRSMGMTATNRAAAERGDESQEWYTGEDQKKIIDVIEHWIKEQGGATPTVSARPVVFADQRQGYVNFALFEVKLPGGGSVLLDGSIAQFVAGKPPGTKPDQKYIYHGDFQYYREHNRLPESGTLYTASSGIPGPDGKSRIYDEMPAHERTVGETAFEALDIGVGVVGLLAAPFTDGISAVLLSGSLFAYGAGRVGYNIYDMSRGGQSMSFSNPEARGNYIAGLATILDLGAIASSIKAGRALQAASDLSAQARMFEGLSEAERARFIARFGEPADLLAQSGRLRTTGALWRGTNIGLSAGGLAAGGEMTIEQTHALITGWADMSPRERAEAILFSGLGVAGFTMGARNLRHPDAHIAPSEARSVAFAAAALREIQLPREVHEPHAGPGHDHSGHDHGSPADLASAQAAARGYFHGSNGEGSVPERPPVSGVTIPEEGFWPDPAKHDPDRGPLVGTKGHMGRTIRRRTVNFFGRVFDTPPVYNRETYARLYAAAGREWQAVLPRPGEMTADYMTRVRAWVPKGLEEIFGDIHFHPYGYDYRAGMKLESLTDFQGDYSVTVSGCIPGHCGGPAHYSTFSPVKQTTRNAVELDERAARVWFELYKKDPAKAGKVYISITGVDLSPGAKQEPVAYIRDYLLKYPGLATAIGEITSQKEMVEVQLGPDAWRVTDPAYHDVMRLASETGLAIVLHNDWSRHGLNAEGRPAPVKGDYENTPALMEAHSLQELRDLNIIFAHTGIGRFVRPDDTMRKEGFVEVVDWDFQNRRERGRRRIDLSERPMPEQIYQMYKMIEAAPNARFDISWNDVTQAYLDNPQLREGLIQFIIDNPTRILFGSDAVKPVNKGHYFQALKTAEPIFAELAVRDPVALWRVLRGNFDEVMDDATNRAQAWTEAQARLPDGQLRAQGMSDADIAKLRARIPEMQQRNDRLRRLRATSRAGARQEYERWLVQLRANWQEMTGRPVPDLRDMFVRRMGALPADATSAGHNVPPRAARDDGVGPALYDALPMPDEQNWPTNGERDGIGTPGGLDNRDPARNRSGALLTALQAGGGMAAISDLAHEIAGGMATHGAQTGNDAAFAARALAILAKSLYGERRRLQWEAIFEDGVITRKSIDEFGSRIFAAKDALGLTNDQLVQVSAVLEQLYKNYTFLREQPVDRARGWDEEQRFYHIIEAVGRAQIEIDRIIGGQASSISAFDPRRPAGQLMRGLNIATLLYNDAVSLALIAQHPGIDVSSVEGLARTLPAWAFAIGNAGLTLQNMAELGYGARGVDVSSREGVRMLGNASNYVIAAGAAGWSLNDVFNAFHAYASGRYSEGHIHAVKAAFEGVFAWGVGRSAVNETNALRNRPVPNPPKLSNPVLVLALMLLAVEAMKLSSDLSSGDGSQTEPGTQRQPSSGLPPAGRTPRGKPVYPVHMPVQATPAGPALNLPQPGPAGAPLQPRVSQPALPHMKVMVRDGVNVHSRPAANNQDVLGAFSEGTYLKRVGPAQSFDGRNWLLVEGKDVDGTVRTGWVAEEFVQSVNLTTVKVKDRLNVRSDFSVTGRLLGAFRDGTVLEVIGQPQVDRTGTGRRWLHVTGKGVEITNKGTHHKVLDGWIAEEFVQPVP
jgi:hypothetical protein